MSVKRKSAFSIYSEEPDENKKTDFNGHSKSKLEGILKRSNQDKNAKKMKKKLSNISSSKLTESISLFSNGKEATSKEFKTVGKDFDKKKKNKEKKNIENRKSKFSKKDNSTSKKQKILKVKNKPDKTFELFDFEEDQNEYEPIMFDSKQEATNLFKRIIAPVKIKDFFSNYWEKKPMLIKRSKESYYKSWFSCEEFDWILRNHSIEFTTNIDIVTYINNEKKKHNPEGRAYAPLVWDFFQQGCSIRLLNPATYSRNVWKYLSVLQELFGCCVGSNVYLTPAGTQGFAPHYDDIEAIVLQLEGKKRWRVYKPLKENEVLPRFSSPNYSQEDLSDPIIDVILEAGDLMYFPRGYIHQANACDDIHSLHITVSTYQKNTWGDFLTKVGLLMLLPGAIEIAMQENVEFRKGLPIDYLNNNGVAFEDLETENQKKFRNKTSILVKELIQYLPIDAAVDQMAKDFIHQSLPPFFTDDEKSRSIHNHGERWNSKKNKVENISEIEPDTSIKIIRRNCIRLVVEENSCYIYHNLDNSKVWCEKEAQYLEVDSEVAPAIEHLIKFYPKYVTVEELPLESIEEKISVVQCLYDKGLIVTGEPLQCDHEESSETESEKDNEISFSKNYFQDEEIVDEEENENGFNSEEYDQDNSESDQDSEESQE